MQIALVTGLSGSGKSIALKVLEDSGYYCVDNLPVKLLPSLIDELGTTGYECVAISVDARSGKTFELLPAHIASLRASGADLRTIFLHANTDTLVKRFSETRRRHPLSGESRTLQEAIELERTLLEPIIESARAIDTSELSPNNLRAWVKDYLSLDTARLTLLFESFGFKYGLPLDADFVFDVRCLPNPHYDPQLRPFTGRDACVAEFLSQQPEVERMTADIRDFLQRWLPDFIRDNRSYVTVAIGCTGGQHRSVYIAEKLAAYFSGQVQVQVRHRRLACDPV